MRATIGGAAAALVLVAAAAGLPVAVAAPAEGGDATVSTTTPTPDPGDDGGAGETDAALTDDASAVEPESGSPGETTGPADDADDASPGTGPGGAGTGEGDVSGADADETEETDDESQAATDRGRLEVRTGPIRVTGAADPGGMLTALMEVTVTDTRTEPSGWAVDVRAGQARTAAGAGFALDGRSYYRARDTACSRSVGAVSLTGAGAVAAVAAAACPEAQWDAELGIAVPADAPPGDYRLTVTHSVY